MTPGSGHELIVAAAEQLPPAPAIGGDCYEVAEWLRACIEHLKSNPTGFADWATLEVVVRAFGTANPEVLT